MGEVALRRHLILAPLAASTLPEGCQDSFQALRIIGVAATHRRQRRTDHDFVGINRLIDLMTRRTSLADKQVGPLFGPLVGLTLRLPQHRLE